MEGLDIEQLQSLQSKDQLALLNTVDELRHHGLSRYISLPQIVVCGDQSSGKSSVLEAISGVQFPVNDGLCTRFTTEVILRRALDESASVKIIPAKDTTDTHFNEISDFNKTSKTSVSHTQIPELISEAKGIMGLTGSSSFSRDVLQLEVSGPKLPHLTLVDLPGLIHSANKEQKDEDVQIPRELVKHYMNQPRSIVLAIVTAKNDVQNQVVLDMIKKADMIKDADKIGVRTRTMGIITKPDYLENGTENESNFFNLANNNETNFKLGWHVLRNGDYSDRRNPAFDRDAVEKAFFSSTIWNGMPSQNRGVESLRKRLSEVLYRQIQTELPSLVKDIERELEVCRKTLKQLGLPRDNPDSQRRYLGDIAEEFHRLVSQGVDGSYEDNFFRRKKTSQKSKNRDEEVRTRLRARVRSLEDEFFAQMKDYGHTEQIGTSNPKLGLFDPLAPKYTSEDEYLEKVDELLRDSKGRELQGTFSPLLVRDLFKEQSSNWGDIAEAFVENVCDLARQFLDDVLNHVVTDENVKQAIRDEILDPNMEEKLDKLKEKVEELGLQYAQGYPATLNPRFTQELERRTQEYEQLKHTQQTQQGKKSIFGNLLSQDPDKESCRQLLHLMQAYYAVAFDVFVDNVAILAVENCLMLGLKKMLSGATVNYMTDETLRILADETEDVRENRIRTNEKATSLKKSYELCKRQNRKQSSSRLDELQKRKEDPISPTVEITQQFGRVNLTPPDSTLSRGRYSNGSRSPAITPNGNVFRSPTPQSNPGVNFGGSVNGLTPSPAPPSPSNSFQEYRADSTPSSATTQSKTAYSQSEGEDL